MPARSRNCAFNHITGAPQLIATGSEEAVECDTIDEFLRLKENWEPFADDAPALEVRPIGVPGAYSPLQMNPRHRPTPSPGPSPMKAVPDGSRGRQIDAGEEFSGHGLEGVTVSEQDLMDLMSELIGEEDAGDLLGVEKKFTGLAVNDKEVAVSGSNIEKNESKAPVEEKRTTADNSDEMHKTVITQKAAEGTQRKEEEPKVEKEETPKVEEKQKVEEKVEKTQGVETQKLEKTDGMQEAQDIQETEVAKKGDTKKSEDLVAQQTCTVPFPLMTGS